MKVKVFDTQGQTKDILITKEQLNKVKEIIGIDYKFKKLVLK